MIAEFHLVRGVGGSIKTGILVAVLVGVQSSVNQGAPIIAL